MHNKNIHATTAGTLPLATKGSPAAAIKTASVKTPAKPEEQEHQHQGNQHKQRHQQQKRL